jgi:hypothetical protein
MKIIKTIAYILIIVGALNWGLVGLLKTDLVQLLFGSMTFLSRLVYSLVGLSGLYLVLSPMGGKKM